MTTLSVGDSISRSPLRRGLILIPLVLACFALWPAPKGFGVTPAPDGGYVGNNTAEGTDALFSLDTVVNPGVNNTAIGFDTLYDNTTGSDDTAIGKEALENNISGSDNTADGSGALYHNTAGEANTANGYQALYYNTTGIENTANGIYALYHNTTGHDNVADGDSALLGNTIGFNNTALGVNAGEGISTGRNNIALGYGAGVGISTGNYNIDIGGASVADESGTIRIGTEGTQTATFIAGIYGETTGSTTTLPVIVDLNGQLGTAASSERFKTEIKPMDRSSEAILALKPATFHYKNDSKGRPQFGLIAEEVAKVNPDLVVRDAQGEIYTVRYEAVNAMLLNEFLKEHRKVQELEVTVAQQHKGMEVLAAQLKEQASQIQKVSAQLELSKTAPRTVTNNQ